MTFSEGKIHAMNFRDFRASELLGRIFSMHLKPQYYVIPGVFPLFGRPTQFGQHTLSSRSLGYVPAIYFIFPVAAVAA